MSGYTIYYEYIQEHIVDGKPLGRHVRHDSRSRSYPYRSSGVPLQSNMVHRYIPILNQGQTRSCTGNAETGALGSGAMFSALQASSFRGVSLDEQFAQSLYSQAETLDGHGTFPPDDQGSTGISVCKAALNAGYIRAYVHTFSMDDLLDALSMGKPVICGTYWYDSFDQPDSNGEIRVSPNAQVRGGHEWLARGIDVDKQEIFCDNSWGSEWGLRGSFVLGWDTLSELLAQNGDGTVSVPLANS